MSGPSRHPTFLLQGQYLRNTLNKREGELWSPFVRFGEETNLLHLP